MQDRRQSAGRRAGDRVLEVIWRELDELKSDLRRYLNELKGELHDDVGRLDAALDALDDKLSGRVDGLAKFQIEEGARTGERVATRVRSGERWTKASIAFGIFGTLFGAAMAVIALVH